MPRRSSFETLLFAVCVLFRGIQANNCHQEGSFVKVGADGLSTLTTPLKTTTAAKRYFCSTECVSFAGCKSFIFKKNAATNNCLLSSSIEGETLDIVDIEIYKRNVNGPKACDDNPCENGGTCVDMCTEPYYLCNCPDTAEGKHCEWSLVCQEADWLISFDSENRVTCDLSTQYLSGIYRSAGDELDRIQNGLCCPIPLAFSTDEQDCYWHDWWNTIANGNERSWSYCNEGYSVTGFFRSGGGQTLQLLEEGKCCKPVTSVGNADCYNEDISNLFDNANTWAKCTRPQYYIFGILTGDINCQSIQCIEEFICCKFQ